MLNFVKGGRRVERRRCEGRGAAYVEGVGAGGVLSVTLGEGSVEGAVLLPRIFLHYYNETGIF